MRVVLCAEGPVEPNIGLSQYLNEHPPHAGDPVHLVFGMRRSAPPALPDRSCGLTVGTFLPGRGLKSVPGVEYHRSSYNEICQGLADGSFAPSVVVACASAARADGTRSLGAVNGYLQRAMELAEVVVVEEVRWLPDVPGAAIVPPGAEVLPTDQLPGTRPGFSAPPNDVDRAIARNIATLMPRYPTLALGIGRINDALSEHLAERGERLALVTGVVTDGVRLLHERVGDRSAAIEAMSVVGSDELLEWSAAAGNVHLRPSTQIHDPAWLAGHDNFVAVLGCIDIDSAGNVNSERAGSTLVSGKGGAPDFALGAHRSAGGRSIIAVPATRGGSPSRLRSLMSDPTIPQAWVDAVATEHGAVVLEGLDAEQRHRALEQIF
jgi:acyl-CoA hydrolase